MAGLSVPLLTAAGAAGETAVSDADRMGAIEWDCAGTEYSLLCVCML